MCDCCDYTRAAVAGMFKDRGSTGIPAPEAPLEGLIADKAGPGSRPTAALTCFLLLTYGLSWAIEVPAALTAYGLFHVRIPKGLQALAQFTPAIAALTTAGVFYGSSAIKAALAPLFKVRVSILWYALAVLLAPATQAAAMLIYSRSGHSLPKFAVWSDLLVMVLVSSIFSAGEELGWRGFFLPRLLQGNSLLAATGWMASVWGLWHLPFYFAVGSESQPGRWLVYLLFLAGIFPVSAFFVLIYSRTKSVILCCVLHGCLNAGAAYWFSPLPTGPGQTLLIAVWVGMMWIAAVPVFVALARRPHPK